MLAVGKKKRPLYKGVLVCRCRLPLECRHTVILLDKQLASGEGDREADGDSAEMCVAERGAGMSTALRMGVTDSARFFAHISLSSMRSLGRHSDAMHSLAMRLEKASRRIRIDLADGGTNRVVESELSGDAVEDSPDGDDIA